MMDVKQNYSDRGSVTQKGLDGAQAGTPFFEVPTVGGDSQLA